MDTSSTSYRDPTSRHFSLQTFDQALLHAVAMIRPQHVLDIGAGHGKYGALIQELGLEPKPHLRALEVDEGCSEHLIRYYDEHDCITAEELFAKPGDTYDTIIIGDVLEHLRYSDGLDLLHYLVYRSAYILVITPEAMPQSFPDSFFESHNSIWRPDALRGIDHFLHSRAACMHFYIIRGYLGQGRTTLYDLRDSINSLKLTGCVNNPARQYPIHLELHDNYSRDPSLQPNYVDIYRPT